MSRSSRNLIGKKKEKGSIPKGPILSRRFIVLLNVLAEILWTAVNKTERAESI